MKTKNNNSKNLFRVLLISCLLNCVIINVKGQNNFTLPNTYHTYKDYDGRESRSDGDFDGDGINDLAIVCENKNETKIIVVYLASQWLTDRSYWWFPWDYNSELSFTNRVLTIKAVDEFFTTTLKLKYYSSLSNMKLIGYAEEIFERAYNNDGSFMAKVGSKSINLNTGEYEVNHGVRKKISIDTITLANIEKYFEYLGQVGGN